jgi:uncharacterized repeat protein (TIGR01451 family)
VRTTFAPRVFFLFFFFFFFFFLFVLLGCVMNEEFKESLGLQIWDGTLHLNNGRGQCLDGVSYGNILPGIFGPTQSICAPCPGPPPSPSIEADLSVTKTVNSSSTLCSGQVGIFTITVTNLGPAPATFVTLADTIPGEQVNGVSIWGC